jgi:hypothetical protein
MPQQGRSSYYYAATASEEQWTGAGSVLHNSDEGIDIDDVSGAELGGYDNLDEWNDAFHLRRVL